MLSSNKVGSRVLRAFDLCSLLAKLLEKNESLFETEQKLYLHLEHIIRVVFYQPIPLTKASTNLITFMLTHRTAQFQRQGIFGLHCLALGLQEDRLTDNLDFFFDETVLRVLLQSMKEPQVQGIDGKKPSHSMHQMVARSNEMEHSADGKEHRNLRIVSLHILVIVLEFANGLLDARH